MHSHTLWLPCSQGTHIMMCQVSLEKDETPHEMMLRLILKPQEEVTESDHTPIYKPIRICIRMCELKQEHSSILFVPMMPFQENRPFLVECWEVFNLSEILICLFRDKASPCSTVGFEYIVPQLFILGPGVLELQHGYLSTLDQGRDFD